MTSNDQAQLSFRDLEFQRSARSCSVKPDTTAIYAHAEVANLRQSGSIDVVIFIFREEMYKPDNSELDGRANVIFANGWNGPTGKVRLTFLKKST